MVYLIGCKMELFLFKTIHKNLDPADLYIEMILKQLYKVAPPPVL